MLGSRVIFAMNRFRHGSKICRTFSSTSSTSLHFSPANWCNNAVKNKFTGNQDPKKMTNADWEKVLSRPVYEVTRLGVTEPRFSGKYNETFEPGTYVCACCGTDLFDSTSKFWSECGWPAFSESIEDDLNVKRVTETENNFTTTECDSHLGHVFDDGPSPVGDRYCINSLSIQLVSAEKKDE